MLSVLGVLANVIVAVVLLPEAVVRVRDSAARMQDQNNMKQIALAEHNYHDARGGFVGPYARDDFGKVNEGLSFRVSLLPYMGENQLYAKFDPTKPWDAPANRGVSDTPLRAYTHPFDFADNQQRPTTQTAYRVFYGGGALFN
ncbi:MAG: DUF1559 domain-containing protein, partial [Gemmataceae bacterium]|nr:DUF1559 domain-containing protein [Gemmataceae bacterium]